MVMKKCTQCKQGKDINSFHNCKYAKEQVIDIRQKEKMWQKQTFVVIVK